jgi:hypothetical protein
MYDLKDEPPCRLSCLKIPEGKSRDATDIALLIAPTGVKDEYQRVGMTYVTWKDRNVFDGTEKLRVTLV